MSKPSSSRLAARWMQFENGAFQRFLRLERRIRALPTNVRLQPSAFDRRVFRLFCATIVSLVAILAVPSRSLRIKALLLLIVVLFLIMAAFAIIDAFPRRSR